MTEVINETDYDINVAEFSALADYVLDQMHVSSDAEVNIIFIEAKPMEELHVRWLNLPGPTDVMSFPMDELREPSDDEDPPLGLLGDIVLCPQVTARQAAENGREPDAEAEYLLIHGLLHLLGHDHAEPEEKAVMFGLNDRIIAAWEVARNNRRSDRAAGQ